MGWREQETSEPRWARGGLGCVCMEGVGGQGKQIKELGLKQGRTSCRSPSIWTGGQCLFPIQVVRCVGRLYHPRTGPKTLFTYASLSFIGDQRKRKSELQNRLILTSPLHSSSYSSSTTTTQQQQQHHHHHHQRQQKRKQQNHSNVPLTISLAHSLHDTQRGVGSLPRP